MSPAPQSNIIATKAVFPLGFLMAEHTKIPSVEQAMYETQIKKYMRVQLHTSNIGSFRMVPMTISNKQ